MSLSRGTSDATADLGWLREHPAGPANFIEHVQFKAVWCRPHARASCSCACPLHSLLPLLHITDCRHVCPPSVNVNIVHALLSPDASLYLAFVLT